MIIGSLIAVVFVFAGVAAYSGRWKSWISVRRGYGSTIGFAFLWLGAAFWVGSLAAAVAWTWRPLFVALLAIAAVFLVVAAVGFFWLPRVLLPRWFRELRGDDPRTHGPRRPRR